MPEEPRAGKETKLVLEEEWQGQGGPGPGLAQKVD